jgi:PAS domain S-box-containing protein
MQPLIDLLGIKDFTPPTHYSALSPLLIWLNAISDFLITLAYYSIPVTLVYFIRQRKDFPYPWVVVLFAGFMLACGTTHLLSVLTIWHPLYWLDALFKSFTAIISVATAALMVWVIPRLLSLPFVTQREEEVQQRQGNINCVGCVPTEITECKHVKEALTDGESRFRIIADNAPVLIWTAGLDNRCEFFNKVWLQFTGRTMEQEIGNGWAEGVHPEDLQHCLNTYQAAFDARQEFTMEYRLRRFDGEYRWLLDKGVPRYDELGVFLGYIGSCFDITERKRLNDQLRISESMKKAVLESSLDAIITIDQLGNICRFNPAASRMFGYTIGDVLGKPMHELFMPERFHELYRQGFQHYLTTGESNMMGQRIEQIARHRLLGEFPVEMAVTAIYSGDQSYFTATIRDITEAKRAEATLRESRELAEQENQVKSLFLAMMSHEIRTPLNALLGTQELLAETTLDTTQQSYLHIAKDAGTNLLMLVNDILDLTKVEAGKLELENTVFDVEQVINEVVEIVTEGAKTKNIDLSLELAPDLSPWISGDPWRFRQVLLNLLSNAIKFTHCGSVKIKLSPRQAEAGDGVLLIEVIDTGIGIAEDIQPKLFNLFTQVDPFDTRKYGGSGLGLSISKRLVELWGGHLGLESQLGAGCRFWFSFGEAAAVPQTLLTSTNSFINTLDLPFVTARLLLVEDSLANQAVLGALLSNGGHQVDLADCGAAGIKAVQTEDYDLIFMDVSMPDMTGMEATRSIRLLGGAAATVPIIAMTAHAFKGYKEQCLAAGMNGFATKPINKTDLLNLVQKWCNASGNNSTPVETPPINSLVNLRLLDEKILQQFLDDFGVEKVLSLLRIFMSELIKRQDAIKLGIKKREVSALGFEAHAIKSGAASFGATVLSVLAAKMEACSYQNDLPTLLRLAEELLPCLEVTLAALQQHCEELSAVEL